MRTLVIVGFLICAAMPAAAKDITLTATPVPLNSGDPQQTKIGSLEFVAGFALDSSAVEWGGYSGMVMAPDGSSLLAVSDVGHWLKLELKHDAAGRLTGVGAAVIEPLLDEAGKPLAGKEWSDAEEIARTPDGRFVVSFEHKHRVWLYDAAGDVPAGPAKPVLIPGAVRHLPENAGIEAMVEQADGRLLLLAESDSKGWLGRDETWTTMGVEHTDGFEPTALAIAPGQKFLLLERRYTEADGPATRISTLALNADGATVTSSAIATIRLPLSVDNFEAMAMRPAPDGGQFIYLLSDDNQSDRQRTLLLQFRTRLD